MHSLKKNILKCAEIFIEIDTGNMVYRCISCAQRFIVHSECVWHIRSCLLLNDSLQHYKSFAEDISSEFLEFRDPLTSTNILNPVPEECNSNSINQQIDLSPAPTTSRKKQKKVQNDHFNDPLSSEEDKFTKLILGELRKCQPLSAKRILQCDICGYWSQNRTQMWLHMNPTHKHNAKNSNTKLKKYCCEICGIRMSELGNLRVHKRIHTGERPFHCQFNSCERRFISSSERTIHMRGHLGEKPYKCELCPKSFTHKNLLSMHSSKHSNERPYQCGMCDRSFKNRKSQVEHTRTHTGQRPYRCDICGKAFGRGTALQVHRNIHTDNRPYKCKLCERGFHSSAARRSHEKIFHKIP